MQAVRIGIMGCGFIGGTHATALGKIAGVKIAALCDSEPGKAEGLRQKLTASDNSSISDGGPEVYEAFEAMLNAEIDAVFVCLPPFAHGDEVERAASAGKHIFIEKPIALDRRHAERMAVAADASGITSQVGYMMRFSPAVDRIRSLIDDGTAGHPTLYQATYSCNALHAPWWREKEKSGGQIFEQAIHLYDLALYFLGAPQRVGAMMANLCHQKVERYTIEDTSSAMIAFENGAIANIAATNCAVPGEWNHTFTLICEKMVAKLTNGTDLELAFTGGEEVRRETATFDADVFLAEDTEFVECVRAGRQSRVPISIGRDGVALVEATTRAATTNAIVHL